MESKTFMFTSIPLLAIILIFVYLNIQQNSALAPTIDGELCQTIQENGEDRIDLLFISSRQEAQDYTDYLFTAEPYKTYEDYFNVKFIDKDPECDSYQGIAIICNTPEVYELAKQCNNDYIIVVKEESSQIRSSALGNLISLNKIHTDSVLVHELGHALANFAEEYEGAKIPAGSKNCQSKCENFKGDIDECRQGCSDSSHVRSIPEGVMRTLITDNYGVYNIALLIELLEKNKPRDSTITGNQIYEGNKCDKDLVRVEVLNGQVKESYTKGCAPDKKFEGEVCAGEVCNINTLFTDAPHNENLELEGETVLNPDIPLIFFIPKNTQEPLVDITLNDEVIYTVNTVYAGATACTI